MSNFMKIMEPARELPVSGEYEVVVCGGGPAGSCAAIAAARSGAKTMLLESAGCLGGIMTTGLMANIIDSQGKGGILAELMAELCRMDAAGEKKSFDVEATKFLLEQKALAAGVTIRLNTHVVAAIKGEGGKITHVVTESKSGREAWKAGVVVDATGDGDVGALAGCGFDLGSATGEIQPMSLSAMIVTPCRMPDDIRDTSEITKAKLYKILSDGGCAPSYPKPTLFTLDDHVALFMSTHLYGLRPDDAAGISDATIAARKEIWEHVNVLRRLSPAYSKLRIGATGAYIGVREGRRIHGLYTVCLDDMLAGRAQEDGICHVSFGIDIHSKDGYKNEGHRAKPYDVPLRSLISRDVPNLMMAGRCISGDFHAHASYRVVGDAAPIGEAAGICAALAAVREKTPAEIPFRDVIAAKA